MAICEPLDLTFELSFGQTQRLSLLLLSLWTVLFSSGFVDAILQPTFFGFGPFDSDSIWINHQMEGGSDGIYQKTHGPLMYSHRPSRSKTTR